MLKAAASMNCNKLHTNEIKRNRPKSQKTAKCSGRDGKGRLG